MFSGFPAGDAVNELHVPRHVEGALQPVAAVAQPTKALRFGLLGLAGLEMLQLDVVLAAVAEDAADEVHLPSSQAAKSGLLAEGASHLEINEGDAQTVDQLLPSRHLPLVSMLIISRR